MTLLKKKNSFVKAVFAVATFMLFVLLASCAGETTQLAIDTQAIEVQASEKVHTKNRHDKKSGQKRGQPFELVANTIGIDMETLKTELDAGKSIATIAQENGVTAQAVIDTLITSSQTKFDEAVAAGKISTDDATAWQTKITERYTNFVNNTGETFAKGRRGHNNSRDQSSSRSKNNRGNRGSKGGEKFTEMAQLLGTDVESLMTELKAGKSLAQIATDNGVAVQTVIDSLVQDMKTRLDEAVTVGKLTAEEAQQKLSSVQEGITAMVNGEGKRKAKN